MQHSLQQILQLVSKPGYKTSEGQLTGILVSGAVITIGGAVNKWLENKTSDAPALLIGIALLVILFACKWYSEHRAGIKGELGKLLNNPMLVEIIKHVETQVIGQAQTRIAIPGAIPIEPRERPQIRPVPFIEAATGGRGIASEPPPPPPDPKPYKIEILHNGEIEIQSFATRLAACQAADALRKEPLTQVYVL